MSDSGLSVDQNPGRWVVFSAGGILCEAGIQAILTSRTAPLVVTVPIAAIGALLILLGVFWNRLKLAQTVFFGRLNRLASHPGLWVGIVLVVWLSTTTVQALKEIRLNNQLVAVRNDELSIANVINRLVLPRRLTERQQKIIGNFLLQFYPHEYSFRVSSRDEEASVYMGDIEKALKRGGWTRATKDPFVFTDDLHEGISIYVTGNLQGSGLNAKNPPPSLLLQEAFGGAGVEVDGIGGGGGADDRITISIGPARHDSYALNGPPAY
jgi:hypothetical protein